MAYSDSFPAIRPSFQFSADAGRLDPRISYTRSTTGSFYGKDKHLSSDNLLLQSSTFNVTWSRQGLGTPTGGQPDPAGGTDGFTLVEDSATNFHRVYQNVTADGKPALTVYAKQNSGSRYLLLTLWKATNDWECAVFDLAGSAPATASGASSTFTGVTATQTASGGGYYKCVLTGTGTANDWFVSLNDDSTTVGINANYGVKSYAGDGSSSIDVAFASLSTTGATDYNATTTQIHRAYAPTLQTAAINAPRFEHSASDSASEAIGSSRGLLIEGQSTNLLGSSADFGGSWQIINSTKEIAAVGPDGTLSAIAFREGTNSLEKRLLRYYTGGGGSVTISIYAKLLGNARRLVIREANASAQYATFDLATGTVVSGFGSIESVGNGWYRCQLNLSTTGTVQAAGFTLVPADGNYGNREYAGDGYSGLLLAHPQAENQSWASSYIDSGTSGSTATRAADSASLVSSSLFDNGGASIVMETENVGRAYYAAVLEDDSTGLYQDYVALTVRADNKARQTVTAPGSTVASDEFSAASTVGGSYFKIASRFAPNDFGVCIDGGAVTTDTSGAVPSNVDKLFIGWYDDGGRANAHIKRVAIYPPLSDTNLQALTS